MSDGLYLHFRVVEAKNLPAADRNGLSDPYVNVYLDAENTARSPVIPKTLNPSWGFDGSFELSDDNMNGEILFEVMDHDQVGSHDFLGQCKFLVADLIEHRLVGGFFELLDKEFRSKIQSDVYLLFMVNDDPMTVESRRAALSIALAQVTLKLNQPKKKI